jgi:hypothetical protein
MSDVTRLLDAAAAGDRVAAADLFPLVYDELRKLAAARMASEAPGWASGNLGHMAQNRKITRPAMTTIAAAAAQTATITHSQ